MHRATAKSGVRTGGALFFLLAILIAVLATIRCPALAATAAGSNAPKNNPRLASLQIEIWPEYDRPAALVILKGEIAPEVTLPATVSVRIPASSGGPSAVAYSSAAGGDLLNVKYEREAAGQRMALKFEVPQRFFHVEFYEPIVTSAPERNYTYVWPGDLATDQLAVIIQEPAGVLDLAATPTLAGTATGQDGLHYRSGDLGAFPANKQLDMNIRYTKTDARTSSEILKPKAAEPSSSPSSSSSSSSSSSPFAIPSKKVLIIWLLSVAVLVILGSVGAVILGRRRRGVPEPHAVGARLCRQCKTPAVANDRFCSKCGAPLE